MLRSLFRSSSTAYPQRQCFFCLTTSVILPPYDGSSGTADLAGGTRDPAASTSALTISTGTPESWFCSSCHCHNTFHPDGSFHDQWTRPMWDEQWNRDRSQLLKHRTPRAAAGPAPGADGTSAPQPREQQQQQQQHYQLNGSAFPQQSNAYDGDGRPTFCHTCQTNQTLQMNLLADYIPDEHDPEYAQKVRDLPAYTASIAARYPSVCERCAPAVQETILQRDQMARSWSLAQWLAGKKGSGKAAGISNPHGGRLPIGSSGPPAQHGGAEHPASRSATRPAAAGTGLAWAYRGSCWLLGTAAVFAGYAFAALRPLVVREWLMIADYLVHEEPLSMASIATLGGLVVLVKALLTGHGWDPTARRVAKARQRGVRPETLGLEQWWSFQQAVLLLRLAILGAVVVWLAASSWTSLPLISSMSEQAIRTSGAAAVSTDVLLVALSLCRLRVRMPPALRLVSRPLSVSTSRRPEAASLDPADEAFRSLSLAEQRHGLAQQPISHHQPRRWDGQLVPMLQAAAPASTAAGRRAPDPWPSSHAPSALVRDRDGDEIMHYSPPPDGLQALDENPSFDDDDDDDGDDDRLPASMVAATSSNAGRSWQPNPHLWSKGSRSGTMEMRNVATARARPTEAYDFKLGPQQFWGPENPTGLEDVFGKAIKLVDDDDDDGGGKDNGPGQDGDGGGGGKGWKRFLGLG
ncbi:uncharacterized protein PFL1_03474 [Pseudozyma flocculosa PF-1]|uniref:Ima1 N-terminal domain-containing protein n=2 Tax=Pseudozyma flocculosa TaxID=84751 RepID=A0A5C3FAS5_9BASI|nr:uncharacterized protein PFL1_03474 [Pseudozyma flocculosa PF-1]EPQ29187.1 hypothetical protein PFL1_03474 [Pseudozyma flocculosa PF-1]SPO41512.1 uncharacterized protein PSFLO_06994 [Pseudozyma flocculosa]